MISYKFIDGELPDGSIAYMIDCMIDSQVKGLNAEFDAKTIVETISNYATSSDKFLMIAMDKHMVIGIFLGNIQPYPFTTTRVAWELYWSVDKKYRGNGIGKSMLDKFEDWARQNGCTLVISTVNQFSSSSTDDCEKRLEKEGFTLFSREFYKRI